MPPRLRPLPPRLRLLLLVLCLPLSCIDAECMTQYNVLPRPAAFDVCLEHECFLFRTESPFVELDPNMASAADQLPFRCKERVTRYPDLKGPFFEIVEKLDSLSDAYCVWAGPQCEFDDMIGFVNNTALPANASVGERHKFVAGGLLFMLSYRMSTRSIPSAPLVEDQLIVVGPRRDDNASWHAAWLAMWRPFTTRAWIMLLMTIFFVLFLRVWVSWFFTTKEPQFDWKMFRDYLLGDYEDVYKTTHDDSMRRKLKGHSDPREVKRLNSYLSNGMGLFFVIIILYYEIAVVDFVFEERREAISGILPNKFVILNKSTQDRVFTQQFSKSSKCREVPGDCWKKVANISAVYDTVLEEDTNYSYTVAYESFNRYYFKQNEHVCEKIQVLEFSEVNRRFAGVWYYSSNIPPTRRMAIDRNIVSLRERGQIRKIIQDTTGEDLPPKCQTSGSISVLLLSLPLAILPGPIFVAVFFYLVLYTLRRNRDQHRERDSQLDDDVTDTENADYSEDTYSGETSTVADIKGLPRALYIPRA